MLTLVDIIKLWCSYWGFKCHCLSYSTEIKVNNRNYSYREHSPPLLCFLAEKNKLNLLHLLVMLKLFFATATSTLKSVVSLCESQRLIIALYLTRSSLLHSKFFNTKFQTFFFKLLCNYFSIKRINSSRTQKFDVMRRLLVNI